MKYLLARGGLGEATAAQFPNGEAAPELVQLTGGEVVMATRHVDGGWQVSLTTLTENGAQVSDRGAVDGGGGGQRDFPSITALSNGGYAVAWGELNGSDFEIRYRSFAADGTPTAPTRTAFADVAGFESSVPEIAALPGGGFAIAASRSGDSYIQAFRNNGTVKTASAELETSGQEIALELLGDGRMVAIGSSARDLDVIGANGVPTGDTIEIGFELGSSVQAQALDGGNTLLVGSSGGLIRGRIYDSTWAPVSANFIISEAALGNDVRPDAAALSDGGAIVTWARFGGESDIQARRIDADGALVGPVLSLGEGTQATYGDVHVQTLDNGNVVFAWSQTLDIPSQFHSPDAKFQTYATDLSTEPTEGSGGRDTLTGAAADDILLGFGGRDVLEGLGGDDALHGGGGDDTATGGNGRDWLSGDAARDRLSGGNGADSLSGGTGRDRLFGEKGDDLLFGGDGNDTLQGGRDADTINGQDGDDVATGGKGRDLIFGGAGNDRLSGDNGNDTILAGLGDNTVTGGAGSDLFIFAQGDGDLRIEDFDLVFDRLDVSDLFFGTVPSPDSYLASRATIVDGDLLVSNGSGVITFVGIDDQEALADRIITG